MARSARGAGGAPACPQSTRPRPLLLFELPVREDAVVVRVVAQAVVLDLGVRVVVRLDPVPERASRRPTSCRAASPTTALSSISQCDQSPQNMPTPSASRTTFPSIVPIDISVIAIPRSLVRSNRFVRRSTIAKCVTMPSRRRSRGSARRGSCGSSMANEMSIPCAWSLAGGDIEQSRIVTWLRRDWMPSSSAPETRDVLEHDPSAIADGDPVLAAEDRDALHGHVVGGDDDAAADDCARLPDSRCERSSTSGPWWTPAGRRTIGGCVAHATPSTAGERDRRRGRERRAPRGRARRRPRHTSGARAGSRRARAAGRRARQPAKNAECRPSGASIRARARAPSSRRARASPSGSATQPGWYGSSRW